MRFRNHCIDLTPETEGHYNLALNRRKVIFIVHVSTLVRLFDVRDVQVPRVVVIVRNAHARVARYHVVLHGEERRLLHILHEYPGNL